MFKYLLVSLVIAVSSSSYSYMDTAPKHENSVKSYYEEKIDDLTIVVSSCGKYSDCWEPFCKLLFKYWPSLKTYNSHIKVIFITTDKDFSYDGVEVIKIQKDIAWSNNIIEALSRVKTKYVLYMQEDYMLMQPVNEHRLNDLIKGMRQNKAAYLQLTLDGYTEKMGKDFPKIPHVRIKDHYQDWRPSLRSALWETDLFLWLLKPGENPWQFESADGACRSYGVREPFLVCSKDDPIPYYNVCNIGYWTRGGLDFLEKEGLSITNPTLPIYEEYPFTHWIRQNCSKSIYKKWVKILGFFDAKFKYANPLA